MATRLKDAAEKLGKTPDEVLAMRDSLLTQEKHWKGTGKLIWLTDEGMDVLERSITEPLTVAKRIPVKVIKQAKNPRWVFAQHPDGHKIPVVIPRRMSGKLDGKFIKVEVIESETGITYRHECLAV